MTYPVVVFVMAILAVIGMLLFIVPVFAKMFDGLGGELPAPTRILVMLSTILKIGFVPFIIVGLIVFVVVWQQDQAQGAGAQRSSTRSSSRCRSSAPLFQKIALSRFTRNLGTMLHVRRADPAEPRHRRRHHRQRRGRRRGPRRPGERAQR